MRASIWLTIMSTALLGCLFMARQGPWCIDGPWPGSGIKFGIFNLENLEILRNAYRETWKCCECWEFNMFKLEILNSWNLDDYVKGNLEILTSWNLVDIFKFLSESWNLEILSRIQDSRFQDFKIFMISQNLEILKSYQFLKISRFQGYQSWNLVKISRFQDFL